MFELLAAYVHGLAMWWNLKIVSPEPQPNKNTKVEANQQKPNRITSAETAADSDKMTKLTTSSHHIAKPHVGSSLICRKFLWIKCPKITANIPLQFTVRQFLVFRFTFVKVNLAFKFNEPFKCFSCLKFRFS